MKLAVSSVVALCLAGLVSSSFAQSIGGRIAVVDMNRVFSEYYKTKAAGEKLKETQEGYQKEIEEMRSDYRKQTDELNKLREDVERPEYTAEVKEQKRKAVQEKLAELQKRQTAMDEFVRSRQQMLQEQQQRMRSNIVKEINDVIAKEARTLNYIMVFDKSGLTANGVAPVVFSQDSLEVTEDILKILNRGAPKVATKKPEEKTPETAKPSETTKPTEVEKPGKTDKPEEKK